MIPKKVLDNVIKASFYPPSAAGARVFTIIVVQNEKLKLAVQKVCERGEREWVDQQIPEIRKKILNLPNYSFKKDFLVDAHSLLVVATNPKKIPYAIESTWLGVAYMLLEARNQGLGTLTYTPSVCKGKRKFELNKLLNLSKDEEIQTVLPIGYFEKQDGVKTVKKFEKVYLDICRKGSDYKKGD